jgi:hypothetical protein
MAKALLRFLLLGGIATSIPAWAGPRPVLYPNAHLETVGTARAQQDIDDCLKRAAGGGTAGLIRGLCRSRDLDPAVKRRFVEKCLRDKGYEVIGWQ